MRNLALTFCLLLGAVGQAAEPPSSFRLPDTGITLRYTKTFGEDADYAGSTPSFKDNGDGTVTDRGLSDGIARSGSASLAAVAPGISEALVATAFGLAAAIPAAIGYNLANTKIRKMLTHIDAFGADLFITVPAHEPEAHYILVGSRDGSITLTGLGPGHVYRDGSGVGHARRAGSGPGCAMRSGAGHGHAYRDGQGDGAAIRSGTGSGHAINHSTGVVARQANVRPGCRLAM